MKSEECSGALNAALNTAMIREEVLLDLDDSDGEADENPYEEDGDVDDLDPFSDSDNFIQLSGSTVHRTILSLYLLYFA